MAVQQDQTLLFVSLQEGTVLSSRNNSSQLTAEALGFPPTSMVIRIFIFPHFTPRFQDLLRATKEHQNDRMLTITNGAGTKIPEFSFARQTHPE